jgi:hypothetical protein
LEGTLPAVIDGVDARAAPEYIHSVLATQRVVAVAAV